MGCGGEGLQGEMETTVFNRMLLLGVKTCGLTSTCDI